ncbi:MAG: hypothetical protein WCD80_01515, partial [Desulfobaccales bacterium]
MRNDHVIRRIISILIRRGEKLFATPYKEIEFTGIKEADELLNDLKNYPHAFVLACLMDRQIKAERAWLIPYEISNSIDGFDLQNLMRQKPTKIRDIFVEKGLHHFNEIMAKYFYMGIRKIHEEYDNDASNIWKGKPKSATIVRRFLQFNGVGIKIASMAANSLVRDFKVPTEDKFCIDISPDIHVKRVFYRLSFIDKDSTNDELVY